MQEKNATNPWQPLTFRIGELILRYLNGRYNKTEVAKEGFRGYLGLKLDFKGRMNQMQIQFSNKRVPLKRTMLCGYHGTQGIAINCNGTYFLERRLSKRHLGPGKLKY